MFFAEGRDVLFRVALSILKLNEPDILGAEGVGDLFAVVGGMTSRLWSADKLITVRAHTPRRRTAPRTGLTGRCSTGTRRSSGTETSRGGSSGICGSCRRRRVDEGHARARCLAARRVCRMQRSITDEPLALESARYASA